MKLQVINVLSKEYYDDCHIAGSINVPLEELESHAKGLDKKTPVVVYCARYECSASRSAWHKLKGLGFKSIWAYEGGAAEWRQMGFSVEGPCQKSYLSDANPRPKEHDESVRTLGAGELKKMLDSQE